MVGLTKLKKQTVYFGHPSQFWIERQRLEMKSSVDVEEMKKVADVVDYDALHLQRLIENRTSDKVKQLLDEEEIKLFQRRKRLKFLLEQEEEQYAEELRRKKEREECEFCEEKKKKTREYREKIDNEKLNACLKALEREKIAKGMMCTKEDEKRLKEMQKLQMLEKKNIEVEDHNIDMMWHQVLLEDVREKEQQERAEAYRRQQEMLERRRAYDEQIASANRKRQQAIKEEREKENRRLEIMKKKMEQDHYDAIKRKKDQQKTNRANFIEGHEMKMCRLRHEKMRAREIDDATIRTALEELQLERERNRIQMRNLQIEKQIFVEYQNRERRQTSVLEEEADGIAHEWKRADEEKADQRAREMDIEKKACKEQAAKEYKKHIDNRHVELELTKQERRKRMERVKKTAHEELRRRLDSAKDEHRMQMEYRNNLTRQIRDNQRHLEVELINTEIKDRPFTKKATMFREVVENRLKQKEVVRESTNPVHPFRKKIEIEESRTQLPLI